MSGHEILVTPDDGGWRVAIVPPLPIGGDPEVVPDMDIAMARARLIRLRHGFPIVAPPTGPGRGKR